jgi:toxin ParE1/3/4
MDYTVRFTSVARKDLRGIHAWIATNDSMENANYVAREIVRVALTLREFPQRGAHPPELLLQNNRSFRQLLFKPYRIFYRISAKTVFIALIADGRRDMVSLLAMRFLLDNKLM